MQETSGRRAIKFKKKKKQDLPQWSLPFQYLHILFMSYFSIPKISKTVYVYVVDMYVATAPTTITPLSDNVTTINLGKYQQATL